MKRAPPDQERRLCAGVPAVSLNFAGTALRAANVRARIEKARRFAPAGCRKLRGKQRGLLANGDRFHRCFGFGTGRVDLAIAEHDHRLGGRFRFNDRALLGARADSLIRLVSSSSEEVGAFGRGEDRDQSADGVPQGIDCASIDLSLEKAFSIRLKSGV
jgi:hypothetical protein